VLDCVVSPCNESYRQAHKLDAKQIREIKALLADPAAQVHDIAERYGVSRTTLYKRVGVVQPVMK